MASDLPTLSVEDYDAFVAAVHRQEPGDAGSETAPKEAAQRTSRYDAFPWQRRLVGLAADGNWPAAIKIPTGLGKTSVIDAAVFALALQADRPPSERTARTRTFVVVDRRLVVDDITWHARALQHKLLHALSGHEDTVVGSVARRLAHLTTAPDGCALPEALPRGGAVPLEVTRMRGGTSWTSRWVTSPEQPVVVIGTIDQLGSRLLFRGYGVTWRHLPIDAALVGNDSLVILDEAHLATALTRTLGELQRWERAASAGHPETAVLPARPSQLVVMSATVAPPTELGRPEPIEVDDDDRQHHVAGQRLRAKKTGVLWHRPGGSARTRRATGGDVAGVLAEAGERLAADESTSVVGIVCNTVGMARSVHDRLAERGLGAELLIGRARGVDRSLIAERIRAQAGLTRRRGTPAEEPCFVVATQTIEVGVNLDFDALVTEAAPLDALIQRVGRLDRLGSRTELALPVRVVIVYNAVLHGEDNPVYGRAVDRTWRWLAEQDSPHRVAGKRGALEAPLDGSLQFGPSDLLEATAGVDTGELIAQQSQPPTVLPQLMLAGWAQTRPKPQADLDIVPFLHGRSTASYPTVTLLWRGDVHGATADAATLSLQCRAPCSQEQVEVPLAEVRRWLAAPVAATEDTHPDLSAGQEALAEDGASHDALITRRRAVLRVGDDGICHIVCRPRELNPGDVLVCPAAAGGLDQYGWSPDAVDPVLDVADLCETRAGLAVRLQPETLRPLSPGAAEQVQHWFSEVRRETEEGASPTPAAKNLQDLVEAMVEAIEQEVRDNAVTPFGELLLEVLRRLPRSNLRLRRVGDNDRELRFVLHARPIPATPVEVRGLSDAAGDEHRQDSDDTTSLSDRPVNLDDHSRAVMQRACVSARLLGLAEPLAAAVGLAAWAHDLGKCDPRFQVWLRGGNALAYLHGDPQLAKSGMNSGNLAAWLRAADRAEWPLGLRHEALSVALYDEYVESTGGDEVDHDLVRHLIGSHHGYNRSLYCPVEELQLVDIETTWRDQHLKVSADDLRAYVLDWSAPGRFRRLTRRYGAWGLALLETVVRLADQTCSEAGT